MSTALIVIGSILRFPAEFAFYLSHLWAVWLIYQLTDSVIATVIALFLPLLSHLVAGYRTWGESPFGPVVLACAITAIVGWAIAETGVKYAE